VETLLLPGMDGTGSLYRAFANQLSPALNPRIVSFPRDRHRSYQQLLEDIPVPAGPFAIVAESFSGPLGILLAARYPERARALVLAASFVRSPSMLARWTPSLVLRGLFRLPLPELALRLALVGMDANDERVSEVRAAIESVEPGVLADRVSEIAPLDVSAELAQSAVPILYIAGRRDRVVGARAIAELVALRPDVEMRVVDAPHLVLQCRPVECATLISEFLLNWA
jgi:pimeloyl-[acyl-carrier protein] methyl ester esterase